MESIPVSALKLGIGFNDYDEVGQNIRRMKLISIVARQSILERAEEAFEIETKKNIIELMSTWLMTREYMS